MLHTHAGHAIGTILKLKHFIFLFLFKLIYFLHMTYDIYKLGCELFELSLSHGSSIFDKV